MDLPSLGPPPCFRSLRNFLTESGYTEQAVCQRLSLGAQHEILSRSSLEVSQRGGPLELLIRLLLAGEYVEQAALRESVPGSVLSSMSELGLLVEDKPGFYYTPLSLYPIGRFFIASDRWTNPDGSHFTPREDIVYPAITKNTCRFLGMLPSSACERFLDLCSGTGVAALTAATGYAEKAWAVDITHRSTHFAEFNRALNGADNVAILQGDLYEPLGDLSFDRIVAHPPYIPASSAKWIFQDAGVEGEEITRRIVGGLARHLSPGGRFYCLTMGVDREDEPFERRVRRWLCEHESEFDVLLAVIETHSPEHVASQPLLKGEIGHREFSSRRAAFERARIERFAYGHIVVQRVDGTARQPFTVRLQTASQTSSAELEWAVGWATAAIQPGAVLLLLERRLSRARGLELRVVHRVEEGAYRPADFTLQADYPFRMECKVHPWSAALFETLDSPITGRALYLDCSRRGWIAPEVSEEEFARFLSMLVSGGFLELEAAPLPDRSNF